MVTVALLVGMVSCGGGESYTLAIASTAGGSVITPGEGTFTYGGGRVVDLVAEAEEGYQFVNWTGNVSTIANVNAASTAITMSGNYSITANFEGIPQYDLTIASTAGGSVITPGEGSFTYYAGTVVDLVAEAERGYRFVNWTGNVSTIANVNAASTAITMSGNYSIMANFGEEDAVTFPDPDLEAAIREAIGILEGPIYPSDLEGLTYFDASRRNIADLTGLQYCIDLTSLYLYTNQISDISPLVNLTSLTQLEIAMNQISDISPLANLTNLTNLVLGGNQISDFSPLANLINLAGLFLNNSNISDISTLANITNLTNLIGLDLGGNQISDISPIVNFANLRSLSLYGNQISDIAALSGLTELRTLYLGGNQISDITPLSGLVKLGDPGWVFGWNVGLILLHLDLCNNQITDISPLVSNEGLSEGDMIDLRGNALNQVSLNTYIPELEGRGVSVLYD